MKDRYFFPAIFNIDHDGIAIEFPDLPGCLPTGRNIEESVKNAKEALALHLYGMEQDGDTIPKASDVTKIKPDEKQFLLIIEVWMKPFRDEMKNKAIKKTLTIPKWLDDLAIENDVNFSHVLQEALKDYLGVNRI